LSIKQAPFSKRRLQQKQNNTFAVGFSEKEKKWPNPLALREAVADSFQELAEFRF